MEKQETLAYWETRVTEYRASGLSAAAFCRQAGIKASTFRYWVKKLDMDKRDAEIAVNHRRALVLTARKLVRMVDALLRSNQIYMPQGNRR